MACMVGFYDRGTIDEVGMLGKELGTEFACVRVYRRAQEWGTVGEEFTDLVAAGKLAVASHKPPAVPDAFAKVARGDYDAEVALLIAAYRQAGREAIFMFNHEPHDNCSDFGKLTKNFRGTSTEYRAAHRHVVERFRDAGATNVRFGYCASSPGVFDAPDVCYPGDEYVDVLCHDLYNWGDFRSERGEWTEFDDLTRWPRAVALAKAAGKPLLIGEFGCHPSAPTYPQNPVRDRNQWFRNAARYLRDDPDARRHVIGFCYFHSPPPIHDFRFVRGPSAPDGAQGWTDAFAHDDYFVSEPLPVMLEGRSP